MSKKRVFISHEYAGNPDKNVARADRICKTILNKYPEYIPISPLHMFSYFDDEDKDFRDPILDFCFDSIENCKVLWTFGYSNGCLQEINKAIREGIPVYVCVFVEEDGEFYIQREKYTQDTAYKSVIKNKQEQLKNNTIFKF